MYLMILALAVAAAAVCAAPLPAVGEVGTITTSSYHPQFINTLPFIQSFNTSFSSQLDAIMNRKYTPDVYKYPFVFPFPYDNAPPAIHPARMVLIVVTTVLELMVIVSIICYGLSVVVHWYCQRRSLRRNSEIERAEQMLDSHPREFDFELDVIHARSTPDWPLADGDGMSAAPPNTPERYSMGSGQTRSDVPVNYGQHHDHSQTNLSEVSNPGTDASGRDITEAHISDTNAADTETVKTPNQRISVAESAVDPSYIPGGGFRKLADIPHCASSSGRHVPKTDAAGKNKDSSLKETDSGYLLPSIAYKPEAKTTRSGPSGSVLNKKGSTNQEVAHKKNNADIYAQNGIIVKDWAYHTS